MSKKRSSSSNSWLNEHFNDQYVKKARERKIRSRSWFKLDDIQSTSKFLKTGMKVLDLGSAPGSWSEYAIQKVGKLGYVVACDILFMLPINGVKFIQGNIREKNFFNFLLTYFGNKKIDVVMSDMAPNMTGNSFVDHVRAINLGRLVLDISTKILLKNGSLLVKSFHGQEFSTFIQDLRIAFSKVKICKPRASRARSREVYILASGQKYSNQNAIFFK